MIPLTFALAPAFALGLDGTAAHDRAFDDASVAHARHEEVAHRHERHRRAERRHRPAHRRAPVRVYRHAPPPPAHVEVVAEPRRRVADPDNNVSIVVNLVDVPAPLLSGGVEVALGRRLGLVGAGGVGFYDGGGLYDVGADLRGYLLGDFDRGVFLGAGIGVTNLTPLTLGTDAVTYDGFVGGKYTFRYGLTVEAAVGVEAYTTETLGLLSPTAKLGVGWSF